MTIKEMTDPGVRGLTEFFMDKLECDTMFMVACKAKGLEEGDQFASINCAIGNRHAMIEGVVNAILAQDQLRLPILMRLSMALMQSMIGEGKEIIEGGEHE